MIRDQLVEETGFTDDARRRYYRITNLGHRVFTAELSRIGAVGGDMLKITANGHTLAWPIAELRTAWYDSIATTMSA